MEEGEHRQNYVKFKSHFITFIYRQDMILANLLQTEFANWIQLYICLMGNINRCIIERITDSIRLVHSLISLHCEGNGMIVAYLFDKKYQMLCSEERICV